MNLFKTSFYTSISTAINLLSGFIVIKVVAVKIGPEGIAYVGQFQNTTAIFTMLATAATTVGVVKYLAQYREDAEKSQKIINTAFLISFFSSLVIGILVMLMSRSLSMLAFKNTDYWIVYFLFGLLIMTVAFNIIFSAILNGLKQIKRLTIVSICSSLIGVACTLIGAFSFGLMGVLLAGNAAAIVVFIINIIVFKRSGIKWVPDLNSWDTPTIKMLAAFSLMAVVSGFFVPAMQIAVRNKIITGFSVTEAGYWQAITRISDYYLSFISSVLGVYYMPRLSELTDKIQLRNEIIKGYKIILPVVGAIALCIWLFRGIIIHILFTPEFLPMKPLFAFQLLGDFFKIGSWLLAYLMLAKAMTKTYIITEIGFSISFIFLSYIFLEKYGIIGATYSFCINYALYWVVMFFIMRKKLQL